MKLKDFLMNESFGGSIISNINQVSTDVYELFRSDYINDKEAIVLNKAIDKLEKEFKKVLKGKGLIHF